MPGTERNYALITGASLGLGRAFARECAARGMNLLLVALPGSGLPELSGGIARDQGVAVDWLEADLTEDASLERLAGMIREKGLEIELLINNAGIGSVGPFMELPLGHHDATMRLNTIALVRLTRLFLDGLGERRSAHILNVASLGAYFPMPALSVYSATKSFVFTFSLAVREELAGRVGVSVLCPNAFKTTAAVEEYVEKLGFVTRLACLTPERIARIALRGVWRDRAVIIPGLFNRALAAVGRVVPRSLAMRAILRYWGGFGEAEADGAADRAGAAMAGDRGASA
jgi:uncharacterized protein